MSVLLFNNLHLKPQPFSQLLTLITSHPLFQSRVIQYRQLFTQQLKSQHLIKLGQLYWTFMLPEYPATCCKRLAIEMLQSVQLDGEVNVTTLKEYLARICQNSVENLDVRNAVGFLDLLKSRITDHYVVDSRNHHKKKVHFHFKLELFDGETVINDAQIPEQFHRLITKDIYFQEKTFFDQQQLLNINQYEVLITELKTRSDEVVPYGYVCQDFISSLVNNDFELKNNYRLQKNRKINFSQQKIQYWISKNQTVNNLLRDQVVNQQIFQTTGILSGSHLPGNPIPSSKLTYSLSKLNKTFSHQNYYQKLKDLRTDQIRYFNILSQFFQRDQFHIDQIKLTREKLIARRKESLLGIQGKQTIKKQQRDFEEEVAALPLKIQSNMMLFHDQLRMQLIIKQLSQHLKPIFEQSKNLSIIVEQNLSQYQHLPTDSEKPFVQDIIKYASKQPLQLLIIGRPKCGKSTLAKAVAKKYSLVYISVEAVINQLFQRQKFFEENPPETDEDGNVQGGLTPIEKCIIQDLNQGKPVDQQDLLDLINNQFEKPVAQSRGFILDLPFQYKKYWISAVISNKIVLPKINCSSFTHIIQIQQSQQQWKYFVQGLMQKPQQLSISSKYQRYLLNKPKPIAIQGQQQQAQPQQQQKPLPLKQQNLLQIKCKQSTFSLIEYLSQHIHPRRYLKVENAYQNVYQCLETLQLSLYKIPLPKKIEGADKELLTVGFQEIKIVRKWSPWGTVDPVELFNHKLIIGKAEFACQYAGRVFLFENQNNLNSFINIPRKYLTKLPQLPGKTNICIAGPRKSGKKTLAKMLSDIYKLQIINFQQIIERIIRKQKSWQTHVPSNPQQRSKSVHLSQGQFREFSKGNLLNAKDVLPMVLYQLGITLQKKPVGWGVEKQQGGQNPIQEQKKAAPVKKKKKDAKNNQDQRPKTPPIQDLMLKQIIPQLNHLSKLNQIKGFILVNFPSNEQQLNSLKQFNIPIDKLLILSDNSQQAPNKVLSTRLNDSQLEQVALFNTGIAVVKQALGQDVCKEIQIDQTKEQVLNKVRQIIDPFYLKIDQDAINRVIADKQQEGDPVPLGYSADYCPVALRDKWLIKGKEEFEAGVQGRRFRCCNQKQFNMFKQNPQLYLDKQSAKIVPPRIMFMGLRGVGLKTQLLQFNSKYHIPILNLKQTLLQQLQAQKQKRKQDRYYKKGFKKPEFDQQGKQIQDEELNAQSAQFDKKVHEIQITRKIFEGIDQIFINANFFDIDEQKISTNLVELLTEARRLPQVVYILKSDQVKWLQRNLDRKAIERQLQQEIQKIRADKRQQVQQAIKAAQQAGEEYNPPADQQEELPKLQEKIVAKEEALKAQRQADSSALQAFIQSFRGLNIQVIEISCQREVKHVTDKINYSLKPYLLQRASRWQNNNMLPIQRHRVNDFLSNFIVKQSRFGKLNPLSLSNDPLSSPLIYNDRIYYLKDDQERQSVMKNPTVLEINRPLPQDLIHENVPCVFILGKQKAGKTTLAKTLAKKLGLVYVSFPQIIENFVQQHQDFQINNILKDLKSGKPLSDDQTIKIIQKRLSLADCRRNGWVLDGIPANKSQAQLLNHKHIRPTSVFALQLSDLQIKGRVLSSPSSLYQYNMQVIHQRLNKNRKNIAQLQIYYKTKYNNLKRLDGNLSKWGLFQITKNIVQNNVKVKKQFVRALALHQASKVSGVGLSFNCIINNISEYQNYCPISYKLKRQYIRKCIRHHQHLAMYNNKIYVFSTDKQLNDFIQNPQTYITRGPSFNPPRQVQLEDFKLLTQKAQNKAYCMVELMRKKLVKGNFAYGFIYKNKYYLTANPRNMKLFIKNPTLYEMVRLPDKLPVEFQKKNELKKIAKRNDCTAFLQHHLSNIMMRSLAQLGYRRPKYPSLNSKQSALKFLSISLKATNPNKDDEYRQKYTQLLNNFIKECNYSQEIRMESQRKDKAFKDGMKWEDYDEENLIKLCQEYSQFIKVLDATDKQK